VELTLGGALRVVWGRSTAWTRRRISARSLVVRTGRFRAESTLPGPGDRAPRALLAVLGLLQAALLAGGGRARTGVLCAGLGLLQTALALAALAARRARPGTLLRMEGREGTLFLGAGRTEDPDPRLGPLEGAGPRRFRERLHLKAGIASLEAGEGALLKVASRPDGRAVALVAGGGHGSSAGLRLSSGPTSPLDLAPEGLADLARRGALPGAEELAPGVSLVTGNRLPEDLELLVGEFLAPRPAAPLPPALARPGGEAVGLWAGTDAHLELTPGSVRAGVPGTALAVGPARIRLAHGPGRIEVRPRRIEVRHGDRGLELQPDRLACTPLDRLEAGLDVQIAQEGPGGRVLLEGGPR
jgi:hypothetical protein